MRKIFLLFASVAFATTVWADDAAKKPSFSGFVSNGFWDNWELSLGAGAGITVTTGTNRGSFKNRVGWSGNFSINKWVHPVVGMRAQLEGGKYIDYYTAALKNKWPYLFAHADLMVNLSNWIGGYRDERAYYLIPYAGFGYMAANFTDKSHRENKMGTRQTLAVAYGLINRFRLGPAVDFNIELKGLLAPARVAPVPESSHGRFLFGLNATAGFTFRFNRRDWDRGVMGYTAEDIRLLQQGTVDLAVALEASEAANMQLNNQLKNAKAETAAANAQAAAEARKAAAAQQTANEAETLDESLILYNIGTATLTPQEQTRLQVIAQRIKEGPKDRVYHIGGHADPQTGTTAINERLAEQRAKAVYDYLVQQGVNPQQLEYKGYGGQNNPFTIQKANRSAVLKAD